MDLSIFKDKKIALLGFGVENISVARFLLKNNIDFTIFDKASAGELSSEAQEIINDKNLNIISGEGYLSKLSDFDLVIRSPGVPFQTTEIQQAKSKGSEITSSTKLFFDLSPAKIIGVTGTKGKGTTASLIFAILKKNLKFKIKNLRIRKVYLAGNIGIPSFDIIEKVKPNDLVVFELSSFQIQDLHRSPFISVITNLDSDHLDYHKNLKEYQETKSALFKHQTAKDFAVINYDYPDSRKLAGIGQAKKYFFSSKERIKNGAYVDELGKVILTGGKDKLVCSKEEIQLIGRHNLENIAAAAIVGKILNVKVSDILKAVKNFKGLEHRLEFVREFGGVKYFNDSFSTNPITTIAAINSFSDQLTLIVGGSEKGADFSKLANKIKTSSVKNIIVIGKEGHRIKEAILKTRITAKIIDGKKNIDSIVIQAKNVTLSGEIILFSPACASFDMFKNYKDRGEQFKKAVQDL